MQPIEFWYSIGSTYSYLTVLRLPDIAKAEGLSITWRPFNVRHIMVEQNNIPFKDKPVKTAYMWRDIARRAVKYGLAPRLPAPYPLPELPFANQVACLGMAEGWGAEFTIAAYRNWFENGIHPDHGAGLEASIAAAGQDPARVIEAARTPEAERRLADATQEAMAAGVFGSPSFTTGGELFWGDDRLEDAITWARHGTLATT